VSAATETTSEPELVSSRERAFHRHVLRAVQALGVVALVVVVIGMITTQGFFSLSNLKAILASVGLVGIVAIGMTVIMISGAFVSLSLGTTAAVTAIFFVYALQFGIVPAIMMTIVLGVAVGAVQGLIIGGWEANPIIVTIAAGAVQSGITVAISHGRTISPANDAYQFLNATPLGLPVSLYVLVGLVAIVEFLMRRTRFGHHVYMTGDSRTAARAAGLPLARIGAGVFGLACGVTAIAGILLGAYNQSASLLLDKTLTYDAIAATLVGGAAVAGGRGAIWRTLLGAVAIATVTDLLLLRGYSSGVQVLVKGLVVLIVVVAVHLRSEETRT
jgi:ribose/xylose/arabinose/galactoside ABC-type transport system permease subunit